MKVRMCNFVERMHAEENRVLSAHGMFKSNPVYECCSPGSKEHRENMEAVLGQMKNCLATASFGGKQLLCY